jgi:hypothetical protein
MLHSDEIARVAGLSEDELLMQIGQSIEGREGLPAFPSRERLIRKGRDWFESFWSQSKAAICANTQVCARIRDRQTLLSESIQVVALAIVDAALTPPVPVATISAVIVRRGIERLCSEIWEVQGPKG